MKPELSLQQEYAQKYADRRTPSISIDRALGHLVEGVEIDVASIQSFYYYTLPHADKIDLDNLHIHLSAAMPVEHTLDTTLCGVFIKAGTKNADRSKQKLTPEIKKSDRTISPTIVLYLGSALIEREDGKAYGFTNKSRFSEVVDIFVNEKLAHELTHFAQVNSSDIKKPNKLKRVGSFMQLVTAKGILLTIANGKDIGVGTGTGIATEALTKGGVSSIAVGIGAAVMSRVANIKDRKVIRANKVYEEYREEDIEIDARRHQKYAPGMISVVMRDEVLLPKGHDVHSLIKPEGERLKLAVAYDKHKELSLTPHGGDPKVISKASFKSELKAIKISSSARLKNRDKARRRF